MKLIRLFFAYGPNIDGLNCFFNRGRRRRGPSFLFPSSSSSLAELFCIFTSARHNLISGFFFLSTGHFISHLRPSIINIYKLWAKYAGATLPDRYRDIIKSALMPDNAMPHASANQHPHLAHDVPVHVILHNATLRARSRARSRATSRARSLATSHATSLDTYGPKFKPCVFV